MTVIIVVDDSDWNGGLPLMIVLCLMNKSRVWIVDCMVLIWFKLVREIEHDGWMCWRW
jgi:hypothetical protein